MKKVLALALAVVLAFGMATVAFAAYDKITGIKGENALGMSGVEIVGARDSNKDDAGAVEAMQETEINVPIDVDNFKWDGKGTGPNPKLTSGVLSNITVKKSVSKGSDVIRDVEIKYGNKSESNAYVRIRFIQHFVSTGSKDFEFKVYLAYKGSRVNGTELLISGTMENQKENISEGDDYFFLGDGLVAEAEDYIKEIEFDLGNGVSVHTKAFDGKKYYGKALIDITDADSAVVDKYPEIDSIYTLKTVNLKGSGNIVTFDIDDTYYVYGADGTYLGLSTEKLPFSDKYYMATARIDMGSSDVSEEPSESSGDETSDPANPPMGGDDGVVNENDNPGTGANGFVNVAVVAGVVALAAAGAVSLKK